MYSSKLTIALKATTKIFMRHTQDDIDPMQAPYSNSDQRLGKVPSLIFTQNEIRDYSHDIDEDKDEVRLRLSPLDGSTRKLQR
ncbi:hypothetical protein N7467_003145 [Penicillium canescens]|nr:hypothetical protein N7467_003145 [Penicillium canescens]